MRIVHVTDTYLPKRGGIETQVHDLACRQRDAGHDVLVVTRAPGGPEGMAPVYRAARGHGPFEWRDTARRIAGQVSNVDQVHAHLSVLSPAALIGLRAATRQGVPAVATYHSVLPQSAHRGLPLRRPPFDPAAVAWTAVSGVAAASVRRVLGPEHPVDVLPNGLDLAPWRAVGQLPPRPADGTFVVVAVGRLASRKRPVAAVRILARAQQRLDRAGSSCRLHLVLVGDGHLDPLVRLEAARCGVRSQVTLTGGLERAEVAEVLALSHAFLSTASKESFGIAAMEARTAGLPVLARSGTGIAELLEHGVEGLIAVDDDELAAALAELAGSPPHWEALRTHNREVPPVLGWAETLHRTELAYKRSTDLARVRVAS